MLDCNASGFCQCKQMSKNEPNIVFFPDVSRRLWHREQCHKKGTIARKNFVVIVSPVGINADMNDETTNLVRFKTRNAYLSGQITLYVYYSLCPQYKTWTGNRLTFGLTWYKWDHPSKTIRRVTSNRPQFILF